MYSGLNGQLRYSIAICAGSSSSKSIAVLDDINSDGKSDFILGDPGGTGVPGVYGAIHLIFGANGNIIYSKTASSSGNRDFFGTALAVVGDVDTDGTPDFVASSWDLEGRHAFIKLISGAAGTFLDTFTASAGADDGFAFSLTSVGDWDGDGKRDFAAGAYSSTITLNHQGSVFVHRSTDGQPNPSESNGYRLIAPNHLIPFLPR